MVMQIIYLILAILGFALPYAQLIPFFMDHGFDLSLFWSELFVNRISTDFAFDLLVASIVFWLFVFREGIKLQMKFLWLYIAGNLLVGLSFALPLFLLARSRKINRFSPSSLGTEIGREAV
ncbi:MAG: DUF2834 domain-containing protein [Cyanobacteria bacterium J06600_6]